MKFNRSIWKAEVSLTGKLYWPCPFCAAPSLRLQSHTLAEGETGPSKEDRLSASWEPQLLQGRFSCIVECKSCNGEIAVSGFWHPEEEPYHDDDNGPSLGWVNRYLPQYFTDAPPIVSLPTDTPDGVESQLKRSFTLFWGDVPACANAIRAALEELMTAQRINKSVGRPKPGKSWVMLSLHRRIEIFGLKKRDLATQLLAVKLIGNEGSHTGVLTREDILDAYEILSHVLDELYANTGQAADALAREINRRKAPRSPRRGPRV